MEKAKVTATPFQRTKKELNARKRKKMWAQIKSNKYLYLMLLPGVLYFIIDLFVKLSETTALHLHNSKRLPMVSGSSVIFWVYDFFLKPQRR